MRLQIPFGQNYFGLGLRTAGGASRQRDLGKAQSQISIIFLQIFCFHAPRRTAWEIKGKSANASYAITQILPELGKLNIKTEQMLVSNFDSDTIVHPQYFARVMYEFFTAEKPYRQSYQPIAIYNNNIWDSPALIRVVSVSNSFSAIYRKQPAGPLANFFFLIP